MCPPMIVTERSTTAFLAGGGEMSERMRSLDWSKTALGPMEEWPRDLRTTLGMMLPSKAQIVLFWGPQFTVLYNDAYRPVFGGKHPAMLGEPGAVAWSEIWDVGANLRELLAGVVRTGEAFSAKDLLFVIERHGFVEETYFDVSYDPVRGEDSDQVGGVYCIVTETTGRVVGEGRLALLRDLAAHNSSARCRHEACEWTMETLAAQPHDVRFALAYFDDELQACTPGAEIAYENTDPALVKELPIGAGRLVVGINQQRPFDERYQAFLDLVAGQLATAVANAQAYEDERKRVEALATIDRAKTAFFSNVSHEFRTPLTLMLGPVEDSLADASEPLSPTQRERQEIIRRNALRLLKMVNSLLDFSRIEARRIEAVYEATDLSAYTAELASTFRSIVERAGLRLIVDAAPLSDPVFVDREMWEIIVLNLLSNAYKFTLEGEIAVALRPAGEMLELEVRDTGSGIPPEELPHIFERFHRVEGTKGRTQEGTGIGLALVQELVKLLGGDISVESSPEVGSAFRVRIPKRSANAKENAAWRATPHSGRAVPYVEEALRWLPANGGRQPHAILSQSGIASNASPTEPREQRARVLLADDNADMRDYVARLLGAQYDVEAVGDGEAALVAAFETIPDLVLADIMMPALDGFGLLQALRDDPLTREIPIVLLSARAGEEARIEGMRAGADDYLVKPFSARELLARVDAHVQMGRMRRTAAERERALRHDAERARAVAETAGARLRQIFMRAPAAIATLRGAHHVFDSANPNYLELIGRGEEILGLPIIEALPEVVEQGFVELLDQVFRTGEPFGANERAVMLNRHGMMDQVFVNFVYQPMFDTDGTVSGIFVHVVDVTKQVLARSRIEEQARELNDARARAEEANKVKATFLATMSHELRTPLNAIIGYTDLLDAEIAGALTGGQKVQLQRIDLASKHLLQMIEEILTFSRIEAGREEVRFDQVDLVELAVETCKLVEPLAAQKALEFKYDGPEQLMARTDAGKMRQILLNLLANAIKFTERGGVGLRVADEDDQVVFEVRDSGVGIAPDQLDRIFEPFHQARTTGASRAGGTGLGLTVSRELARLLGGDLLVASSLQQGSTFTLRVPTLRVIGAA